MTALTDIWSNIADRLVYIPSEPLLFSSGTFWALFLVFLPLYSLLKKRLWQMVVFVVLFSFYFYYKCSGVFVCLLAGTSLIDWLISKLIARPGASKALRRAGLCVSLACSLGILAYFKYANFFLWNINAMVGGNFQPLDIILPVGISFYTFQSVSYIVDVYKGRVAPTPTWLEYAFFLAFFP
ncbi:MAG: MBOAT family protein, partial [Muribaculaceae bacterium]|nr:MBOAT family protein [Muribaculaceae bacterium]